MIQITDTIAIDDRELDERFVRASGPGGQNVNKVSTAVELRFDVGASSLPFDVKAAARRARGQAHEHRGRAAHRQPRAPDAGDEPGSGTRAPGRAAPARRHASQDAPAHQTEEGGERAAARIEEAPQRREVVARPRLTRRRVKRYVRAAAFRLMPFGNSLIRDFACTPRAKSVLTLGMPHHSQTQTLPVESAYSPTGFLDAWAQLVGPAGSPTVPRRRGRKPRVPVADLLPALTYHVLSGAGTLAEHFVQLFGEPLADSSWADWRARSPWQIFADLMQRALRPRPAVRRHHDAFWRGWRLLALDGTQFSLMNTPAILATFPKARRAASARASPRSRRVCSWNSACTTRWRRPSDGAASRSGRWRTGCWRRCPGARWCWPIACMAVRRLRPRRWPRPRGWAVMSCCAPAPRSNRA